MSQQKIDALKKALADLGISYDPDFGDEPDSYEIQGDRSELIFSVRVAAPEQELPDELKPYGWNDYEVDRAISKGNADKLTLSGARFEIALTDYAHKLFAQFPEVHELEASLDSIKTRDELNSYQARREAIWKQMWAENIRLQELQKDLDENYY